MGTNLPISDKQGLAREDLLYPELSYQIVGILFDIFNELGYQYQEKYYQRAIAETLKQRSIKFEEQKVAPIFYQGKNIGRYFFDFFIDSKIILEIKRGDRFNTHDIRQVVSYLAHANLELAILARFSSSGLKFKRIVNLKDSKNYPLDK